MHNINKSIGCTVSQCKFHDDKKDYCTLNNIKVVTHENKTNKVEGSDCGSYEPKNSLR